MAQLSTSNVCMISRGYRVIGDIACCCTVSDAVWALIIKIQPKKLKGMQSISLLFLFLPQKMFYSPQLNEEEFWVNPRGSFRAVSCQDGGGIIEVGPAAEDVVICIRIDSAGLVQRIQVLSSPQNDHVASRMLASGAVGGRNGKTVPKGHEGVDVEAHVIYSARHHIIGEEEMDRVLAAISMEMEERCSQLGRDGRMLEAERLRQRTENDLLLIRAVGTCKVT